MKETKEEKILEYKKRLKEYKHELKTDEHLDCCEYANLQSDIRHLIIKIANLNGMEGITGYWNLGGFKKEIVDLIFEADKKNLDKLRKAYPELVNICRGTQI